MPDQTSQISWRNDVPVSESYGDPYFSLDDGHAESRYVFLEGNGLPRRFRPGFHIAELGFGTGLNLLVALQAARAANALPLRYSGFEAHPLSPQDMRRALSAFPGLTGDAQALIAAMERGTSFETDDVVAKVHLGDARQTLPAWKDTADAWFLDGFAPARNPALWEPGLLSAVFQRTAPGGTAATYSAAGHVRRGLAAAGFTVERRPGFARKRHMTVASRP